MAIGYVPLPPEHDRDPRRSGLWRGLKFLLGAPIQALGIERGRTAVGLDRFFLNIDSYVAPRQRSYAMRLLRSITPSQRWGIGELAPAGWKLYFKGGWGYGTGLLDHQVALLVRGCARVSIAVLTMYDGSHAYGKATLKGLFGRLLRRFPTHFKTDSPTRGAHVLS